MRSGSSLHENRANIAGDGGDESRQLAHSSEPTILLKWSEIFQIFHSNIAEFYFLLEILEMRNMIECYLLRLSSFGLSDSI